MIDHAKAKNILEQHKLQIKVLSMAQDIENVSILKEMEERRNQNETGEMKISRLGKRPSK